MSFLIVQDDVLKNLQSASSKVTICTPQGAVLGTFHPANPEEAKARPLEPDITEEELRARLKKGGGRPAKDVIRDLREKYGIPDSFA